MTREKIAEHAALVVMAAFRNLDQPGGAILAEATDLLTNFYRATLEEAARAMCQDCGREKFRVAIFRAPDDDAWCHPDGEGYSYECPASKIHDLLANLDEEVPGE